MVCGGSGPDFNDVSVLHVQLRRRLAVRHMGAVEEETDFSPGAGWDVGQVLGEDRAQRSLLKQTESFLSETQT